MVVERGSTAVRLLERQGETLCGMGGPDSPECVRNRRELNEGDWAAL